MVNGASQIDALVALIREGPALDPVNALGEARSAYHSMLANLPVDADVEFEHAKLGGVPVIWARPKGVYPESVLLYLHGGAYCMGSAEAYRPLAAKFGQAVRAPVCIVNYRLAPEHAHPAAIEDVAAVYTALLESRPGLRVVLAGDSAGGGLCMTAMLYLRGAGLPLPMATALISPWIDLTCSGVSTITKAAVDPSLKRDDLIVLGARYLGDAPQLPNDLDPLRADLAGLPPTLIQVGSAEILLDDSTRLAAKLAAANVAVTMRVWPDMIHVWHAFFPMMDAGLAAISEVGRFLSDQLQDTKT